MARSQRIRLILMPHAVTRLIGKLDRIDAVGRINDMVVGCQRGRTLERMIRVLSTRRTNRLKGLRNELRQRGPSWRTKADRAVSELPDDTRTFMESLTAVVDFPACAGVTRCPTARPTGRDRCRTNMHPCRKPESRGYLGFPCCKWLAEI